MAECIYDIKPKRKPGSKRNWYLYIVTCSDKTLYTGITTDLSRRLKEHNSKKGAFYTKNKTPVFLVYQETLPNQSAAFKREAQIKRWPRAKKLAFINRKSGEAT